MIALLLAVVVGVGAAAVRVPSSWRLYSGVPGDHSPERQCAGRMGAAWRVTLDADIVGALQQDEPGRPRDPLPYEIDFADAIDLPLPPPPGSASDPSARTEWARNYARDAAARRVVAVRGGWLVGFDAGEFGGSLWWYPQRRAEGRKLSNRNVREIISIAGGQSALVFVGLNHMGTNEGAVLSLGTW